MNAYLQEYSFVLKHKVGVKKKVVDALIRPVYLMATLSIKVIGFDKVKQDYVDIYQKKQDYVDDNYFSPIYAAIH